MTKHKIVIGTLVAGSLLVFGAQARPIPADQNPVKPPVIKPAKHQQKQTPRWPHLKLVMEPPKLVFTVKTVEQIEQSLALMPRCIKTGQRIYTCSN